MGADPRHAGRCRLNVAVLSEWFPPEKAAIPHDVATGLLMEGHNVAVVTAFPNYPTGKIYSGWRQRPYHDAIVSGIRIRRVWHVPSHDRSPVRRAVTYLSFALSSTAFGLPLLRRSDAIYVYHPPLTAALGAWFASRFVGVPYVLHVQDLWPDSVTASQLIPGRRGSVAARVLAAACTYVYRRAAAVICIAPGMADLLVERGVARKKIHVVLNWADESIFRPSPPVEAQPPIDRGDAVSVMYAGNVGDVQGLNTAVRAAAAVRDIPGFRLEIVGDGLALAGLKRLVTELCADNVIFRGPLPVDQMQAVTVRADAQLVCLRDLPLFAATIPSKIGVAMACGVPVICTVAGNAAQLVRSAACGWTCPPEDVAALAAAFRSLATTPVRERAELGRRARSFYLRYLSRAHGVESISRIVADVAARS